MPLYDTLGETAIEFIMNHAEIKFVVGNAAKLPCVLKALKGFKGQLKGIAYWGTAPADVVKVRERDLTTLALLSRWRILSLQQAHRSCESSRTVRDGKQQPSAVCPRPCCGSSREATAAACMSSALLGVGCPAHAVAWSTTEQ